MRQAVQAIYQRYGVGYAHDYGRSWQLLDIDMSGMPAGRQGNGSEKGYFAKPAILNLKLERRCWVEHHLHQGI